MNPNPAIQSHPRLVCRVVRQGCVWAGVDQPRHAINCPDCRAYFAVGAALDASLRRDAAPATRGPSDDLELRILQAVRRAAPTDAPVTAPAWHRAWAVAAALVVAVGMGIFYRDSGPADVATVAEAEVLSDAVESLSRGLVDSVIPSAGALVAENPLQHELNSIVGDARSALGFLALNFLPAASERVPPVPARRS